MKNISACGRYAIRMPYDMHSSSSTAGTVIHSTVAFSSTFISLERHLVRSTMTYFGVKLK